jgi:hypothetical protein
MHHLRALPLYGLAALLVATGASKHWPVPGSHAGTLFLPTPVLLGAAVAETVLGILLLVSRRPILLWLATVLGLVFLTASAAMVASGRTPAACGCFGRWRVGMPGHVAIACCIALVPACELLRRAQASTRLPTSPGSSCPARRACGRGTP